MYTFAQTDRYYCKPVLDVNIRLIMQMLKVKA